MKYIMLKRTWNSLVQELPIIFPEELPHNEVFDSIKAGVRCMENAELVSAGFVHILDTPHCFGVSDSLCSESRRSVDSNRIREYINNHGVVDSSHDAQA